MPASPARHTVVGPNAEDPPRWSVTLPLTFVEWSRLEMACRTELEAVFPRYRDEAAQLLGIVQAVVDDLERRAYPQPEGAGHAR